MPRAAKRKNFKLRHYPVRQSFDIAAEILHREKKP